VKVQVSLRCYIPNNEASDLPVECMTVDVSVCTQGKLFDPEEGLCIVLARLSTVGRWREIGQGFLGAPARAVKSFTS
jgi:hypothetical protein